MSALWFLLFSASENEVKYDTNNNEEEEGELFDFDSGDEVPEADRQAPSAIGTRGAEAGVAGETGETTPPAGQSHSHAAPGSCRRHPDRSVLPGGSGSVV